MNIGPLNTRCRVEYQVNSTDPTYGTPVTSWALLDELWCGIQDAMPSRAESVRNGLETARNQTRWRARFRNDIDSTMSIVIMRADSVRYQIIGGPAELGNHDGIECMLERYASDG